MSESLLTTFVHAAYVYAAIGIAFAFAFAWRGAAAIDPAARGATWGFRLLIIPGATALWPLLLRRWIRGMPPPTERNAHRTAAGETTP